MISIEEFNKALGKSAKKMKEVDILKLQDLQHRMVKVLLQSWKENGNKKS